ncbi:MAG: hypothetical protein NC121_00805 [Blautia sp.]|nr:hypothetical protein [Blautia sp.]
MILLEMIVTVIHIVDHAFLKFADLFSWDGFSFAFRQDVFRKIFLYSEALRRFDFIDFMYPFPKPVTGNGLFPGVRRRLAYTALLSPSLKGVPDFPTGVRLRYQ